MDNEQVVAELEQDTQLVKVSVDGQEQESAPADVAAVAEPESKAEDDSDSLTIERLTVGMKLKGKVRNIVDFGAFIDIGVGRDGLAHISALKKAGIDGTFKVGDSLDVQIRRVDLANNRISLTIPNSSQKPKASLQDLHVNSMVTGRVVRLVDFGAFVDIGAQSDGLLHISELAGGYVRHPSDVLQVGEEVEVRILDVDSQKHRISLSMKDSGRAPQVTMMAQSGNAEEEVNNEAFRFAYEKALKGRRRHKRRA
jgi:small subunit ribosomal protein S1